MLEVVSVMDWKVKWAALDALDGLERVLSGTVYGPRRGQRSGNDGRA